MLLGQRGRGGFVDSAADPGVAEVARVGHPAGDLCICGRSGTGKSNFTEALGQAAIEAGMTVAWFTIEDLGALVRRYRADDSLARAMARLIRTDLIIVDALGLLPLLT